MERKGRSESNDASPHHHHIADSRWNRLHGTRVWQLFQVRPLETQTERGATTGRV